MKIYRFYVYVIVGILLFIGTRLTNNMGGQFICNNTVNYYSNANLMLLFLYILNRNDNRCSPLILQSVPLWSHCHFLYLTTPNRHKAQKTCGHLL